MRYQNPIEMEVEMHATLSRFRDHVVLAPRGRNGPRFVIKFPEFFRLFGEMEVIAAEIVADNAEVILRNSA